MQQVAGPLPAERRAVEGSGILDISFVVATLGTRDSIHQTFASIRREAARLGSYEILVCGYVKELTEAPDLVKWQAPGYFPPGRVFFHGIGAALARKPWVAVVADDMTLEPGWGEAATSLDPAQAPVIFGQLLEANGKAHDWQTMSKASSLGLIDRHLLHRFPIQVATQNEDGLWCEEIARADVDWRFCERLRWRHHGSPKSQGGFGSTYY